jgi:Zn-finger nucleic acid-binding protein
MTCPNCGEMLRERERLGIEIDVCPQCRGVWLDRGELDKLIARESRYYDDDDDDDDDDRRREPSAARRGDYRNEAPRRDDYPRNDYRDRDRDPRDRDRDYRGQESRKKKGFFQTMMENITEGGGEGGGMD